MLPARRAGLGAGKRPDMAEQAEVPAILTATARRNQIAHAPTGRDNHAGAKDPLVRGSRILA